MLIGTFVLVLTTLGFSATNTQTTLDEPSIMNLAEWLEGNLDRGTLLNVSVEYSNLVAKILSQTEVAQQLEMLKQELGATELKIEEKRKALTNIAQKIDMLKLTPSQIAIIETYNRSLVHEPDFWQWLHTKSTWFEVGKDVSISLLFFLLGILWDREQQKPKTKRFKTKSSADGNR